MKLTDLLAILAFLITIFVGGHAWTEYQKSVTGQQDIRKNVVQKDLTEKERKCKLIFECANNRTE
jgi:hypothetical protein